MVSAPAPAPKTVSAPARQINATACYHPLHFVNPIDALESAVTAMDAMQLDALNPETLPFARSYQLEALEKALKQNTIVFMETGSGKTFIAVMLLRSFAHILRKPSSFFSVFLVPQVVLVPQQAEVIKTHTDLSVGKYWGDMGVDFWDAATWKQEIEKHEVLVMTPAILLNGLRHSFFKLSMIKVLIMDECHHARGKHPYACIMEEFYHRQSAGGVFDLPRIFGMTASPIKSKVPNISGSYWKKIQELETLLNSKVYSCASESVIAEFVPFSRPIFRFYHHKSVPDHLHVHLSEHLNALKAKHELSLRSSDLSHSAIHSTMRKMSKIHSSLKYCLDELGIWFASKAAEYFASYKSDDLIWGKLHVSGEKIVKSFSLDAFQEFSRFIPVGTDWIIAQKTDADVAGGLLSTKSVCLLDSLLEYRTLDDIRCIVFVQRVIAAIVIQSLISKFFSRCNSWKTMYIAGNSCVSQCQTRSQQNELVEEFRKGKVNILVSTSILEEGLDVQSCNLVIRFDPATTVCSSIQSRGRARMHNSDYLLMIESGDIETQKRLQEYLVSGDIMRQELISHALDPCSSVSCDLPDEDFYHVDSTGAIVTLSSSISLLYFYCSRLPSDCYFKPTLRCEMDNVKGICQLYLPKSCPIKSVTVQGEMKKLKRKACLEACKQLHQIGALTDNLVPSIVLEEAVVEELGKEPYDDNHPVYLPHELGSSHTHVSMKQYHCYLLEMKQNFDYEVCVDNLVLVVRSRIEIEEGMMNFELDVGRGSVFVGFKYIGTMSLPQELVVLCRKFQVTLFTMFLARKVDKPNEVIDGVGEGNEFDIDYFVLPSVVRHGEHVIDWRPVDYMRLSGEDVCKHHLGCNAGIIQTIGGPICTCMILNSLVYTPHNGFGYCITDIINDLNGNSLLKLRDGSTMTYKDYYKHRHSIQLHFSRTSLLKGRQIFNVRNYLCSSKRQKEKEPSKPYVELPPELCQIIIAPLSINTLYSFSFVPSIMHRFESLLLAVNLKRMHLRHWRQQEVIPTIKVLEAITSKKCQEKFHLESLEAIGDSFLKYCVSRQLFTTFQNDHEGLLSARKDKIVSNAALCRLGCRNNIPGFIRDEYFEPTKWLIPGDVGRSDSIEEITLFDGQKMYIKGRRKIKRKTVADVVEALIGAYLSTGGEWAGLQFLDWIGVRVDFMNKPYERHFQIQAEKHVYVKHLEALLNYTFRDPSLLVEALTHGSFMVPEIPRCYQRLEFLGDAVVDFLITMHLYKSYPGMSPGLLTDMRSASVNNDCYAQAALKAGLHKHILHASTELHKHMTLAVKTFEGFCPESTFGWESEIFFPKVLGDVIESLAGAILVDSEFNRDMVFRSMRPLLEPLVTPETLRLHPVRELNQLCQKFQFELTTSVTTDDNGVSNITVEVKANDSVFKHTSTAAQRKLAEKLAAKEVLKCLKETFLQD